MKRTLIDTKKVPKKAQAKFFIRELLAVITCCSANVIDNIINPSNKKVKEYYAIFHTSKPQ